MLNVHGIGIQETDIVMVLEVVSTKGILPIMHKKVQKKRRNNTSHSYEVNSHSWSQMSKNISFVIDSGALVAI